MKLRQMANQEIRRDKLRQQYLQQQPPSPLLHSIDNDEREYESFCASSSANSSPTNMLRALTRTASIKSTGQQQKKVKTPPTLDPNIPTEPAQPCVFTDREIRTTIESTTISAMPNLTQVEASLGNPQQAAAASSTSSTSSSPSAGEFQVTDSLRRLVPNEVSNDDSNAKPRDETQNTANWDSGSPKRKTSWYSWVWNDGDEEKTKAPKRSPSPSESQTQPTPVPSSKNRKEEPNNEPKSSPSPPESVKDKSWAFWSKGNQSEGEIAIKGTKSEDHPKSISKPVIDEPQEQPQPSKRTIKPNIVEPTTLTCFPMDSQVYRLKSSFSKIGDYLAPKTHKYQEFEGLLRCGPRKVRKAVVIGVHGFFPAKVVRSILGEPTGTSIKFANEAAMAVQRWADEKGYDVEIEKIALEGEGKVLERVESLYNLLTNWMDLIHKADFVYFAAHSQGTPVAVHLLAKLVEDGHVERKQLALLGMAGISLGPVPGLNSGLMMKAYSSIENASLSELFQFQRLDSLQSRKYLDSLRTIINHDAKICFVGSMNDQLVPLYSSTCAHVSHPNIFRSVYVDGQDVVAPQFISTLITIALHLRNIGSSDHGVLKEISSALTGPLTGGGHSKIYNEPQVYDLMVRHALETVTAVNQPVRLDTKFKIPSSSSSNPYLLPWCMRGMMVEANARSGLLDQLDELVEEFENWTPENKQLKDLKYRLSAISQHYSNTTRPKL